MGVEKKNSEGMTAYDVLHIVNCPLRLPHARSMTQATIDYHHNEDYILKWYEENKQHIVDGVFNSPTPC